MLNYSTMKRVMAMMLSLSLLATTSLPAYSGVVTTDQLLKQQVEVMDRESLVAMLAREDVREQLIERGVDPDYARERINALSDAQIEQLKTQIDTAPAGSGVVGVLIAVLLVLIILDIVGVTNIFTFIKPQR